jgi:hypothetical protein
MSRVLLRRLAVIVCAYALALQPVIAASLLQRSQGSQVFCSGASDNGAPPAGHGSDVACCLSAGCGSLSAVVPYHTMVVSLSGQIGTVVDEPQMLTPAPERYPRSRSPPA